MAEQDYSCAEGALTYAAENADWAGLRYSSETTASRCVRNDMPEKNATSLDAGAMCEVLVDGHFGYAATADTSAEGLQQAFDRAIATTRITSGYRAYGFTKEQRPATTGHYQSPRVKPLDATTLAEINDCLSAASAAMKGSERIVNRSARAMNVQTRLAYFSSIGAAIWQDFDMVNIELSAAAEQGVESQTRSWSHTGQFGGEAFDRAVCVEQARRVADEALELLTAENCPTGAMDLILMPDQMMLQIHESIGHPLELDRILGDERNYAGWSFVKPADFGTLRYGSPLMNISFDPTVRHEFASYAFDDGGNPATRELLIEGGLLRRGLGSLESQRRSGLAGVANFRSASWNRAPIDRMANLNLEPGSSTLDELIAQVENGVLMTTNRSWSIDDYRNKFQFGCERGQLIRNGKLTSVVRNPNYRGVTVDFWSRLAGVGKDQVAFGTPYCGKGEPSQVIRVGHASPPCLFKGVQVFGGAA
jgi:predicted Zn-dependent protease